MRIVSVYRYFWPDNAPYGRILKIILSHFSEQGHKCTVITGYPSYNYSGHINIKRKECIDGISVRRFKTKFVALRSVDFFIFFIRSLFYIIRNRKRYDLILINSFPPVCMGLFARISSWITGIPYIYHVQDVHPECLKLSGGIQNNFLFDKLKYIDKQNCKKAIRCVTLSRDMKEELKGRGYDGNNIHVINNPSQSLSEESRRAHLPEEFPDDKFIILFAGNIGRFQNLDLFVGAAKLLQDNNEIVFVFMGDGCAKAELIAQAGGLIGKNIVFIPYQDPSIAGKAMMSASVGLVSLIPGLSRVVYPSKVPTLLNHERPVLLLVEPESELAKVVVENNLGFVLSKRDPKYLAESIEGIWREWDFQKISIRKNFTKKVESIFGINTVFKKWNALFAAIEKSIRM